MKKFLMVFLVILTAFSFNPSAESISAENIESVLENASNDTLTQFRSLSSEKREQIMKALQSKSYSSKDEMEKEFDVLVKDAISSQTGVSGEGIGCGGGGSSGTHRSSPYEVNIVKTDGTAPQDGEPIKTSIEVLKKGAPLTYVAAVYDSCGRVTDVKMYKAYFGSENSFELETAFKTDSEMRIFSFADTENFSPVGEAYIEKMENMTISEDYSESLAVTGKITEINVDSFTLQCTERLDGGNAPTVFDKTITVESFGAESIIYNKVGDVVFGLKRVGNTYTLTQTSIDDNLIHFSYCDIDEHNQVYLKTDKYGKLNFSSDTEFYGDFEKCSAFTDILRDIYVAYVKDGTIDILHSISCNAEKVVASSGGFAITSSGERFPLGGKAGDVVEIHSAKGVRTARIADGIAGTWTGSKFETEYGELGYMPNDGSNLYENLAYTVYTDESHSAVIYAEVTESEPVLVFDVSGKTVVSEYGAETFDNIVTKEYFELPCMMNIYRAGNTAILSPLTCIAASYRMQYDSQTNSFGQFLLKDDTRFVAYAGTSVYNFKPKNGAYYTFSLYSEIYGADYAVIEVSDLADICDMYLAAVAEVSGNTAVLYSKNGTSMMDISGNDLKKGDIVSVYSLDNTLYRIYKVLSTSDMNVTDEKNVISGRICEMTNRAISVYVNDVQCVAAITADTPVYVLDTESDTLTLSSADKIFCNPVNIEDSDYAAIAKSKNSAQIIIVVK